MNSKWIWAPVAGALGLAVYAGDVLATPQSDVTPPPAPTTKILAQSILHELHINAYTIPANQWQLRLRTHGLSDGYVVDNIFTPGASTGWHSHPGPSLIFVVSGSVTNYSSDQPGCAGQTYTAGQSFVDEGGSHVHTIVATQNAETIAVQILPHGAPRKTGADEPPTCHIP